MADPFSVMALAGLMLAGRRMSQSPKELKETYEEVAPPVQRTFQSKTESPSFSVIAPQKRTTGGEILEQRNRLYDQGRMNNLSPVEKQLVGPGLGVGPTTPSFGGFQQLFRVNPENVGAYRLTTLPGRSGPAQDITGGRQGLTGEVFKNKPEKTAYLHDRRPPVQGRASGQGGQLNGVVVREEYERTKRTTNRSETGLRTDGLSTAPGKSLVSAGTVNQDPTRNKWDDNNTTYIQKQPGIVNYYGGYTNTPESKIAQQKREVYTTEQLNQYGFRPDDKRGKVNRPGNAGRMNVRADAVNQGGMLSSVRVDTSRTDGRTNPANGSWSQDYVKPMFSDVNVQKGMENPYATQKSLDVAKVQMQQNPFAQSFYR